MSSNPFEALAEQQLAAPVKAKHRAAERRAASQAEKELLEQDELNKQYRAWWKKCVEQLLAGPHGEQIKELFAFAKRMDLHDAPELIERCSAPWLQDVPLDDRHVILTQIDRCITRVREKNGLPPYDDPMIGEPDNAFMVIRGLLGVK